MRVLFITRGIPNEKDKTLGIFEYAMAKALHDKGHQVTYLSVDLRSFRHTRRWGFFKEKREGMEILHLNLPFGRFYNPLRTVITEKILLYHMSRYMKEKGPFDVLHSHFPGASYFGAKLKEKFQIPLVVTEHSSKLKKKRSSYLTEKLNYAYRTADQVTAVSRSLAQVIEKEFRVPVELVTNILNFEVFDKLQKECSMDQNHDPFVFVSTGNLIREKGMMELISSFQNALPQMGNSELYIFGQGPLMEKMERRIEELGLQENIYLKGLVSQNELGAFYEKSHVFVLPSYVETFGVAYIEAMAMGLPVIATACGGPEEFVHGENGMVVPVQDQEALTEAMIEMKKCYDRYDSKNISEEIKKKYSPLEGARRIEEVYNRIGLK